MKASTKQRLLKFRACVSTAQNLSAVKVEQHAGIVLQAWRLYCCRRKMLLGEGRGGNTILWDVIMEHLNLRCNQKKTIKGDCVCIFILKSLKQNWNKSRQEKWNGLRLCLTSYIKQDCFILPLLWTMSIPFCDVTYSLYSDLLTLGDIASLLPINVGSIIPPHLAEDLPSSFHPPGKNHSGKAGQKFWVAHDVFYFWDVFLDL